MTSNESMQSTAASTDSRGPFAYWRVFKTIDRLEKEGISSNKPGAVAEYGPVTSDVICVLKEWGSRWGGQHNWYSFLNKNSLQHEAEECIVALHHFKAWCQDYKGSTPLTVVDMCCGKGMFSMLLSYLLGGRWSQTVGPHVKQILLFDKAKIDFYHIHEANSSSVEEQRPQMLLWPSTNMHDYDILMDKFLSLNTPLAMVGIHLCKMLGPSAISLINGLKPAYACLAPCCLPRMVTSKYAASDRRTIPVHRWEDPGDRANRLQSNQLLAASRSPLLFCYVCQQEHRVKECPTIAGKTNDERTTIIRAAALKSVPCWNCGQVGHFRADCRFPSAARVEPPTLSMDVSSVLSSEDPFGMYCQLISGVIEDATSVELHDTGLQSDAKHENTLHTQEGNWNLKRKAIYIVASR